MFLFGIIVGTIIAAIAIIILVEKTKGKKITETKEKINDFQKKSQTVPVQQYENTVEGMKDKLEKLNIALRTDVQRDEEVVGATELIIDILFNVLPQLNTNHSGSELTYVANKIAKEYLGTLLIPYLKLSNHSRAEQKAELMNALKGLKGELDTINSLLEGQQVDKFKTQATFLRHKFFGETVEATATK